MKILFTPHWNRYCSYFSNEQYDVYFKVEYYGAQNKTYLED